MSICRYGKLMNLEIMINVLQNITDMGNYVGISLNEFYWNFDNPSWLIMFFLVIFSIYH